MTQFSTLGMIAAFTAGGISFLSPCVLPLVPGYVSYVAGQSITYRSAATPFVRLRAITASLFFVLGFSTVFVVLGASATMLGELLLSYRYQLNLVGGAIVIGFGLLTIGILRPFWLQRDVRFHVLLGGGRPLTAYLLGMAFGFGWTPCIGPILGTILTVSASSATVADGVTLLAVYSVGLGVPFLLAAAFTDVLVARLKSISRAGRTLQLVAGSVMIIMGVAMVTGQLSTFSYWLLDNFPILSTIG